MTNETIKVKVEDQQNVDRILKKFKRLCESYGIVREYKRRQSYSKPSVCLKEKRKAADKRRKKAYMKQKYSGERI
ncbi:MAG: 30S ribosomal protein S21 [Oligoflexia bacterium]|nr:30S ribosomal protein S21 [Oligoflexia bacterium]MBF0359480.1 30S ribosomal protein S21 [Oligoflexia bacterium]